MLVVTELYDASLPMWCQDLQHQQLDGVPRGLACSSQVKQLHWRHWIATQTSSSIHAGEW